MFGKLETIRNSCQLFAWTFVFTSLLAGVPAVADPTSQALRNIIAEVRPPFLGCPCNFLATANWAGWNGPNCEVHVNPDNQFIFSASLISDDEEGRPEIQTFFSLTSNYYECYAINDRNERTSIFENISIEAATACLSDLNQVGISLGMESECLPISD